jgi:hypothetical protein
MSERILVPSAKEANRRVAQPWSAAATYRVAGWVGLVLALAALTDYALAFYPLGFGSAEWEMGTISSVVQGLPLLSIGLVGVWVSGAGLGRRGVLLIAGAVFLLTAAGVLGSLVLFLTDVPIAIRATQGVARLGIQKLITKTLILGLLFGASYIVMGVLALKQARGSSSTEAVA